MAFYQKDIKRGDRVTILVPSGLGRNGQEYKEKTGTAVMHSAHGGWVLNMGGKYGTPGLADEKNTIAVSPKRTRRLSVMDIAADACGLVKVRVNGKTFYE